MHSILHQAVLLLPTMVRPVIVGTEGLGELSRGGTMGDQVAPVKAVRRVHLYFEAIAACGQRDSIFHASDCKHRCYLVL